MNELCMYALKNGEELSRVSRLKQELVDMVETLRWRKISDFSCFSILRSGSRGNGSFTRLA